MHNDKTTREEREELWTKQSTLGDLLFQIVAGILIAVALYLTIN